MSTLDNSNNITEQESSNINITKSYITTKQKDKSKKSHYFPTKPTPYSNIVNAKTGIPYPFNFSSNESKGLYHVIDSTAKYDSNGFIRNRKLEYINEPIHLFYDSPEQYKMHYGSNITTDEILAWHNKQKELDINIYECKNIIENENISESVEVK